MFRPDFEIIIKEFRDKSNPNDRYTSFDYCYNYFRTTNNFIDDIEKSCLTLGFYLASWGMFRGSSFLLQKSLKYLEPTIRYISTIDKSAWQIDVDNYHKNTHEILEIYKGIKSQLIFDNNTDLTLITKIQLGVFGIIPAFDNYFCETFRTIFNNRCGFRRLNLTSLSCIQEFYDGNKTTIDNLSSKIFTIDFTSEKPTNINYTKAKIIDMYGFTFRQNKNERTTKRLAKVRLDN